MICVLIGVAVIALGYWFLIRPHSYWLNLGVPHKKPTPIFGDNFGTIFRTQSIADMVEMMYNAVDNVRYSGHYQFLRPNLLIKSPELLKQITVKDFDHFFDRRVFIPEDVDPLWAKNLVALTGKKWRDMRSTLSPVFTSSKMKFMFSLISKSGQQFADYFLEQDKDQITIEMKDNFSRFCNDVIANTAFGVECDSLKNPKNDFYTMGKDVTNFSSFFRNFKLLLTFMSPYAAKIFNVRFFSEEVSNFFVSVIKANIVSRQTNNIVRPDLIHLLMEARKHGIKHEESEEIQDTGFATVQESDIGKSIKTKFVEISDVDIAAQALVFFLGGFEAVSNLMCFTSYELAVNPDIQDRLIEEIDRIDGELTYESLMEMKYMDMVISESLRKWPNSTLADRICTKPYTIKAEQPGEKPLHLDKGFLLTIPIWGLHRDPQYWPNPEKFDPERFNNENKHKINPYAYIPFGVGPRNCIGSRFALLETKIIFYYILKNFKIVPMEKTQIPLRLTKKQINLAAENGFWLALERR